jgi:hypothetical protein
MNRPCQLVVSCLVTVSLVGGCGRTPSGTQPVGSPTDAANPSPGYTEANPDAGGTIAQGVRQIPIDELAIGDYMPPLDDGAGGVVEIAKPIGWVAIPRKSGYLMRFREPNRKGLPRIEMKVETRTYGFLDTVTSENVEQFAKLVAAELSDNELIEDVVPLLMGEIACARYVEHVKLELEVGVETVAERLRLMVLQNGQLYTIDLLVNQNTLKQSRNAAYAVCAGLRFGEENEPTTTGDLLPN